MKKILCIAVAVLSLLASAEKRDLASDVLFICPSWLVEQSKSSNGKIPLFTNVDGVWTSCYVDLLALQRIQIREAERQSKMKQGVQLIEEKLPFFKPAKNCNLCRGSGWMMKSSVCKCIRDRERALKKRQEQREKEQKR